ncbi:MAG: ATPase [Verrucomicrobia bacterium]|nr:ATPase [Verrucomicrobiota bacterium]
MTQSRLSLRDFSLLVTLIIIWGFFAVTSPQYLSARNLSALSVELAITATLALGMLLVILPGHIDLSVGSGVGLIGGIAAVLVFNHDWPAILAFLPAIAVALLVWYAQGTLIVRQRIPAFIITLGGLLVFKGVFWLVINTHTVPVAPGGRPNLYSLLTTYYLPPLASYALVAIVFAALAVVAVRARRRRAQMGFAVDDAELAFMKLFLTAQGLILFVLTVNQFRGIPLPVVILGTVALAIQVITRHTPFGRHLYAIGGNEEAAFVSGVPVQKVVIGAFTLLGGIVAITGLMQTAYGGAATTTVGDQMELDAIAACVIGGTSLRGGRGTVLGVIFGALIMASLLNGMTLLAVAPELKFIVRGVVLTLAVWMDVKLAKR